MTRRSENEESREGTPQRNRRRPGKPVWADGLRKLYDGVVAEPLPDSFEDLLKKLDQAGK